MKIKNISVLKSANAAFLVMICAVLSGCPSSLKVTPVKNEPVSGIVYALPFTQFDIEIKRTIASCDNDEMAIAVEITSMPKRVADVDNMYSIDVTSLSTFFNHASTNIEFYEDTLQLKTFNTEIEDKSVDLAISVIKTAAFLTKLSLPISVSKYSTEYPTTKIIRKSPCSQDAIKTIDEVKSLETKLKASKEATGHLGEEVATLAADIANDAPTRDDIKLKKLSILKKKLKAEKVVVEVLIIKLNNELKKITHTQNVSWPKKGNDFETTIPYEIPESVLERWLRVTSDEFMIHDRNTYEKIKTDVAVYFQIKKSGLLGVEPENIKAAADKSAVLAKDSSGIRYRSPAKGQLVTYIKPLFLTEDGYKEKKYNIDPRKEKKIISLSKEIPIAQLGFVNVLPIETGAFESSKFNLSLTKNGYLLKAGYEQTKSASESVSSITDSVVSEYKDYKEAKETKKQAALDSKLKELQTQVSINEQMQKLQPASGNDETVAAFNAKKEMLEAEIAVIRAENLLEELKN